MTTETISGFDFSDTTIELRPLMEWWESYPRLDTSYCSFCPGQELRNDLTVTKHHRGDPKMPLGYVSTRCPEHQTYWESVKADRIAQFWAEHPDERHTQMNPRPVTDQELTKREKARQTKDTLLKLWEAREALQTAIQALYQIDTDGETLGDIVGFSFIDRAESLAEDIEEAYADIKGKNK